MTSSYTIVKKWRLKNKDKLSEQRKRYKQKHPLETREQAKKDARKYYYKIEQKSRIKKRYGISFEEFNDIKNKQNNLCAICSKKEYEKELNIDHNHTTGKVRGLLCLKCNTAIGLLNDDKNLLKKAINYLNEK